MMFRNLRAYSALATLLIALSAAGAGDVLAQKIYLCEDDAGAKSFQDRPCNKGEKTIKAPNNPATTETSDAPGVGNAKSIAPRIGAYKAKPYSVAVKDRVVDGELAYLFVCASSSAATKEERAHTLVKVTLDHAKDSPGERVHVFLAPHKELCQEGRITGMSFYNPEGDGWKGVKSGNWRWWILTTDYSVTKQEIADTLIYERNKEAFQQKYGVYDYAHKLNAHVRSLVGREPVYVKAGAWVDHYYQE